MHDDVGWMRRALCLARKGKGRTAPNPVVGAVLVRDGRVVGEGFHQKAGGPHAEVIALQRAGEAARGSTLYINLEPCSHFGKTPPCAPAVIGAGVERVCIGMQDPNPLVSGRGIKALKEAGLKVEVGVLQSECVKMNEAFCKFILKREPFVILKAAATLDGKVAARTGDSKWISGESSRRLVHRLRNEVDGVLVGVGTVMADDPLLTARIPGGRDPYRIILDSRLRIPEGAMVLRNNPSLTIIAATDAAGKEKVERLRELGARVLLLDSKKGKVNLSACLARLGEMGMMSILVEGGSEVNGSFLDDRVFDKLMVFLSPCLAGGREAPGIFGAEGIARMQEAARIERLSIRRVAGDILLEGYLEGRENRCSPAS